MSLAFRHRLLGDQQPKQYGLSFDGVDDYTLTPLDFTSKTEVTLNFKVHVTQSPIDAVKGIVQFANTLAATAPLILVTRRDQGGPYISTILRFWGTQISDYICNRQ